MFRKICFNKVEDLMPKWSLQTYFRWENYRTDGKIKGTKFVAFKVPLKKGYSESLPPHQSFTPGRLLKKHPQIKLVIDLTATYKYYNGVKEFQSNGVQYEKIICQGLVIPSNEIFNKFASVVDSFLVTHPKDCLIGVHCTHGVNRTGYLIVRYMIERLGYRPSDALKDWFFALFKIIGTNNESKNWSFDQIMPGDDISRTFKRCRSAINVNDPTLRKIAQEINLAEMLLLQYLKEMAPKDSASVSSQNLALDHLSQLIIRELEYLRKVKNSEVVSVSGSFVTFRGDDGEFLVTVVPEDELQRSFHPLFSFSNIKPRFAKPVSSSESFAMPSPSAESVYYDACYDLPTTQAPALCPGTSDLGRSIHGMLSYIFASTIGKMDAADEAE